MKKSFKKISYSWYFKISLLGLVLRLVLMPITAHPDIWSLNSARYFLIEEGQWNVYEYLSQNLETHSWIKHYSTQTEDSYLIYYTYPPLSYLTFGFFSLFLKPFYQPEITPWVMEHHPDIYHHPGIFKHLFLFKLPYLFFDFGIAYLLFRLFSKPKDKRTAFALWLFNPVSIYAAYMVGQFELMPIFFVLLSIFLAQKGKKTGAALSLGVGAAYKMYPLFFVPVLAVLLGKKFREKLVLLILGIVPFVLSVAPFLASSAFRRVVLFSTQSQKFMHMSWPLSGAEGIVVFVFLWGLIFFAADSLGKKFSLWWSFLTIMLIFFSVTHYHPQWFVWLTPFLIIQLIKTNFKTLLLTGVIFGVWVVICLFFESSLNYGLFIPINPSLYKAPSLAEKVHRYYNVFQLKTILRSLFAAAAAVLAFETLKLNNEKV